ncbi:MAG: hypothetical protein KJO35_04435 [Gammaproteobacteria bacterium]|nr:hypothetical protein [Gammaproteobacteria bacterium]
MADTWFTLKKFLPDMLFIGLSLTGALACWFYSQPVWMLVICLILLVLAIISLLGDLGFFGSGPQA